MKDIFLRSLILFLLLATSCSKENGDSNVGGEKTNSSVTFNISINSSEGGYVDNSGGNFPKNQKIIITATSNEGYRFEKWSDGNTDNPREIIITSDLELEALFIRWIWKDDNGIIKAGDKVPLGTVYEIDGKEYKVVSLNNLKSNIGNGEYFSRAITSKITNMSYLFDRFSDSQQYMGNITKWDVSNVTNMEGMFYRATYFDQDISNWDVSNVENMELMFYQASVFFQDLSQWNVDNVTNCKNFVLISNTGSGTWPKPNFTKCDPD